MQRRRLHPRRLSAASSTASSFAGSSCASTRRASTLAREPRRRHPTATRKPTPHGATSHPAASAAACRSPQFADSAFTISRPPGKAKRPHLRVAGPPTAMHTVPTGFCSLPPPGPAMPVMPTPTSTPARSRMPVGHRQATGSLTAPCSRDQRLAARRAARSSRGCCRRRRCARRSRSCPGRRSGARSPGRRCTTRRAPPASRARAADRRPRPRATAPSVLTTSAPSTCVELRRPPRRAPRRPRPRRRDCVDRCSSTWPEPGENRRLDRRRLIAATANRSAARSPRPPIRRGRRRDQRGDAAARRRRARARRVAHLAVHHRLHLARRARQQRDHALAVLDPQARRGAVRIGEDGGAARHLRLAAVDRRHPPAARREARSIASTIAGSSSSAQARDARPRPRA